MNTSRVIINEVSAPFTAAARLKGVSFVAGITKRGPFADPSNIITSWSTFERVFGGELSSSDFPFLCKRILKNGGALRVSRIGHYTDPADKSTLDAVAATQLHLTELEFDAALVASNSIAITIDGSAATPTVFDTSNDNTLELFAANLAAHASVAKAEVVEVAGAVDNNRKVLVWSASALTITGFAVTSGASQPNTTSTARTNKVRTTGGVDAFSISAKNAGADYNNVYVEIKDASNGNSSYFDVIVAHQEDGEFIYARNIKITGNPTAGASNYLQAITASSDLVAITYEDLSGTSGQIRPANGKHFLGGGSDGSPVVAADYVGDSGSKTGFHAFDGYDDSLTIACPEISTTAVHLGGTNYAKGRGDIVYFAHLDNTNLTPSALISAKDAISVDTSYVAFFAGGIKHYDYVAMSEKSYSELGDVLALAARGEIDNGDARSFAGTTYGEIPDARGVVNNFGGPGNLSELNLLANNQINTVIQENGKVYLKGNFTGLLEDGPLSFLSTRRYVIGLKKNLKTVLSDYLEQPNDIPTWRKIYNEVKPILTRDVDRRAIWDNWVFDGDQGAANLDSLTINQKADVLAGQWQANLQITPVAPLQTITLTITIDNGTLSIEDNL